MVRLKGTEKEKAREELKAISIPYGSIKSRLPRRQRKALPYISIPYGSIKRLGEDRRNKDGYSISIPYGSIKRDAVLPGASFLRPDFNSLWFD